MPERLEITTLLPHIAELRRDTSRARRLAQQASTLMEIDNLKTYADDLDREADAAEVRLAILRTAMAASDADDKGRACTKFWGLR